MLDRPAQFATRVRLATDGPAGVFTSFVDIQGGKSSATFLVFTDAVAAATTARVEATIGETTVTGRLKITPVVNAASAMLPDLGCQNNVSGPNDDISTTRLAIGFPLTFFGTSYDQLWINNNGNVTFDASLLHFTPS